MNSLQGPMLMVLSMAGFAAEDAIIKALSARVPVGQVTLCLIGFMGGGVLCH